MLLLLKENIRIKHINCIYPKFWLYSHGPLDADVQIARWVMHADIDFNQDHILYWSVREWHKRVQASNKRLNIYTDYLSDTITCMKYEALF